MSQSNQQALGIATELTDSNVVTLSAHNLDKDKFSEINIKAASNQVPEN